MDTDLFPKVTNNKVSFQWLFGIGLAQRQDMRRPKVKIEVSYSNVRLKVKLKVIHTFPNCYTNFIDEPLKFPRKLKSFKLPLIHN